MDALVEINRILDRWLLRYRIQQTAHWSLHGLVAGLVVTIIAALWAVPRADILFFQFTELTIGLALVCMILAGLIRLLWPIPRVKAARYFDRRFQLKERVSTAIEFYDSTDSENSLLADQRQDALENARRVDLNSSLPWRISWFELGAILILILVVVGLANHNQPYFLAAMQKQALKKQVLEQATELEEIRSNIQKIEGLSPDQRSKLEQPLDEAIRGLNSAQSLEEAMSALNQAEQEMRVLSPVDLAREAAELQQAGGTIAAQENSSLKSFGENLALGDYARAAQELDSLDATTANQAQQDALADDLQYAADLLSTTNPDMAQSLQTAADSLKSGNASEAGQALSQAQQTLSAQAGDLTAADTASQTAAQLSASQQRLAQSDGNNAQASTTNQTAGGENTGSSTGSSSTGSNSGSGAGQGDSQGDLNGGNQAGLQPIDTANQPGDGGERPYENIYTPERLGSANGPTVQLPGSGQTGEVIGQTGQAPGTTSQNLTPYTEVYPVYENLVRQAIESGQVPQHYQALVRDYFSSLAP